MPSTLYQIEFYRENGYLQLEDIVGREILTRIRTVIDAFIERSYSVTASNSICYLGPLTLKQIRA